MLLQIIYYLILLNIQIILLQQSQYIYKYTEIISDCLGSSLTINQHSQMVRLGIII